MKQRNAATKDIIDNAVRMDIAYLVEVELPGNTNSFSYYTNYFRDIQYEGRTYATGSVLSVGAVKQTKTLTSYTVPVTFSGTDEVQLDRANNSDSFVDRIVRIYRVYIKDGEILEYFEDGTALPYFFGTVSTVTITEDANPTGIGSSRITWNCANEFSDFERINARITDNISHRGLESIDGNLVPTDAAKKDTYKTDTGFQHANKSVDILAEYQTLEKRTKMVAKKRGGLAGLLGGKKYKMVEYYEEVTREVDLRFDLTAKYLPIVYGVQKVSGIPVFVDTDVDNPNVVWVVYAFCEGEIEGFLDFYMDDQPIICVSTDDAETDSRVCFGNKRNLGDTVNAIANSGEPNSPSVHAQEYVFDDGLSETRFWTYHGKTLQEASQVMVDIAARNGFRLQPVNDPSYWDENSRLADTAYAVFKFIINEDRTEIPLIDAEIEGRKVVEYDDTGIVTNDFTGINPVWHMVDYLTDPIAGAGIPLNRLDLSSFIEVSEICKVIDESYISSWVPYWRYVGWKEPHDKYRYKLQGSIVFQTEDTIFDNISGLLEQYGMSLNIVQGLYTLTIESADPAVVDLVSGEFVSGRMELLDDGAKTKYNSAQASITDPAKKWETNAITFYNAEYKEIDKGVDKKAPLAFPYITNYYTARTHAAYFLDKSRYSRKVNITLPYKYDFLKVDDPITLTNERYNWDKVAMLTTAVEHQADGKIKVTAREYDRTIFDPSNQFDNSGDQNPTYGENVSPPRELEYVPTLIGENVENIGKNGTLRWKPSYSSNVAYYTIRITGILDTYTVEISGDEGVNDWITFDVLNLPEDTYTFSVKAVTVHGNTSTPAKITVEINPMVNLPAVSGFSLVNSSTANPSEFIGRDVLLIWETLIVDPAYGNVSYRLVFKDKDENPLLDVTVSNATAFNYTYTANREDYETVNGSPGFNREMSISIEAITDRGGRSVSKVYL